MVYNDIKHVLKQFCFEGEFARVEEMHSGNINNTYHLIYKLPDGGRNEYILQQINTYAFKKPEEVMSNVYRVTDHLTRAYQRQGGDPTRRVLQLIETRARGWMYRDDRDRCWRAYHFIGDAVAYDRPESARHFMEAGRAFGNFQKMLLTSRQRSSTIPSPISTIPASASMPSWRLWPRTRADGCASWRRRSTSSSIAAR